MSFNAILKPATSATYSMGYQRFHTWIPYIHRIPSSHEIFLEVSATKGYPQSSSSFWLDFPWNKPSSNWGTTMTMETSIVMCEYPIWLVVSTYPSEKSWSSSVGMMKFLKYGKSFKIPWKPVTTKQQVIFWISPQNFKRVNWEHVPLQGGAPVRNR